MSRLHFLKTDADFARFRSSRGVQNSWLRIKVVTSLNQNNPRFGFIIPKKVLAKATDRNKVKRRLKTVLSKHQSKLKAVDLLFFPAKPVLQQKFANLETEVIQLFSKANLWKF